MSDQETAPRTSEQDAPRRARSRSPSRKTKKSSGGGGGFKWKSKPTNADNNDVDDRRDFSRRNGPGSRYDGASSSRGSGSRSNHYRDDYRQDRDRDYRDRDRDRDSDRNGRDRRYRSRSRSPRRDGRDRRDGYSNDNRRGSDRSPRDRNHRDRDRDANAPKKEKKEKAAAPAALAVAADGEEMIIVHVNDRLGTKAAIPCFASDNVGAFKVMVAARIGREPHEILLKRQGERPFKDHITLGDYGVSNGVQLDLEVDTGD